MKDEEMAEEYAEKECCTTCKNINHSCKEKCECWTFAKKGFLAGLKAGRPQWHYVKDGDLPKDDKEYLVIFCYNDKGAKRMCYEVRDNLQHDFEIHRCYTEQIIAWKEIVPPKEIE